MIVGASSVQDEIPIIVVWLIARSIHDDSYKSLDITHQKNDLNRPLIHTPSPFHLQHILQLPKLSSSNQDPSKIIMSLTADQQGALDLHNSGQYSQTTQRMFR
jgi:hypothetical protein